MRKYKSVPKDVLSEIICDVCGAKCEDCSQDDPLMAEYATLEAMWGYCSTKDGDRFTCDMCEKCFDKVVSFVESIKKN
jgi:hypothetical protein